MLRFADRETDCEPDDWPGRLQSRAQTAAATKFVWIQPVRLDAARFVSESKKGGGSVACARYGAYDIKQRVDAMGYKKPKNHMHREFLYMNHDTILNSLSAMEAGKIDEIIQKANQAREGGFAAGISGGPLDVSGGKKKTANIEEEMVRTRTIFSAFDAWHEYLNAADAIGTFDEWNKDVRDQLTVGDTIEFGGRITLTPVHMVFRTYLSFAEQAETPGSVLQQKGEELRETKQIARMIHNFLGGKDAPNHFAVYVAPNGSAEPRVLARLDEAFMLSPREGISGEYQIIAQVDEILREKDTVSAMRMLRDVPPTPMEGNVMREALAHLIEPAKELGVDVGTDDITIDYPAIVIRPIAVFR